MSQTSPPSLTQPPAAPQRNDPPTFVSRADAFVNWIVTFVTEIATLATNVYNNAVDAYNSAVAGSASQSAALASENAAAASAASAAGSAGAAQWVYPHSYSIGDVAWSPITRYTYRCISATSANSDPSTAPTYWALAAASMPAQISVTTSPYNAVANGDYLQNYAGAGTINLPASPSDGDAVWVTIGNGRADNVIGRNGKTIMNQGTNDLLVNDIYGHVRLRYVSATGDWTLR